HTAAQPWWMPLVGYWPSYVTKAVSAAASAVAATMRAQPESSIKRSRTSRHSRSRESRSSAFKKATRERSSSSAAEYPSFWTEPSSVRSEQVPAPLNKTLRLQRRLSLHLVTRHSRPMHLVRVGRLPSETMGRSSGYPQSTASRNLSTRRWWSSPKTDLRQPPSET